MTGDNTPSGPEANQQSMPPVPDVDVEFGREPDAPTTPWGAIAGAGALVLAIGAGAFFLTNGETEIESAQAQEETVAEESTEEESTEEESTEEEGASEGDPGAATAVSEDGDEPMVTEFDSMAMDSIAYEGPMTSTAVFDGERFVSLMTNGDGWMLRTSPDGVEWTEAATTGIPDDGYIYQLLFDGDTFAAMMQSFDEESGSFNAVVSSVDGLTWTQATIPSLGENTESGVSGLALLDGQAVFLQTVYETGPDPMSMLIDAGVLSQEQYENFCGFGGEGENDRPIEVLVCDFDEENYAEPSQEELDALAARYDEATTDEERQAIERELEQLWGGGTEVVAVIEPSDPLHAAILEAWFGEYEYHDEFHMDTSVVAGPLAGPFAVVSTLPKGYYNNIIEAGGALYLSSEDYDQERGVGSTQVLTSVDGSAWSEVGTLPVGISGQIASIGDTLVLAGYDQLNGTPITYISIDGAQTWSEVAFDTGLFESYSTFLSGPAGHVSLTTGLLEPYYEGGFPEPEIEEITLNSDGYTLNVPWSSEVFTLIGPDGNVIYEFGEEDMFSGDNPNVRENPISGNLTFLDADTGEELVTFTQQDWEEAYEVLEGPGFEGDFGEPEQGIALHFSTDGTTWTELDVTPFGSIESNSYVSPVAVGDDEAVFMVTTWSEPPADLYAFEAEGREPTQAEIDEIELWDGGTESVEYVRIPLS